MILRQRTWKRWREELLIYSSPPRSRRSQLVFRGQPNSDWTINSTLDRRLGPFLSDADRDSQFSELLEEFRREAIRLEKPQTGIPKADALALQLLARHHGLPSPIIDWTESPYIASFFAYADRVPCQREDVAVWMLNRAHPKVKVAPIDIIDDVDLLKFNIRALKQRGVFVRVRTGQRFVEEFLGDALVKIELPVNDRLEALSDLDEMGITATALFDDLDSAARTSVERVSS